MIDPASPKGLCQRRCEFGVIAPLKSVAPAKNNWVSCGTMRRMRVRGVLVSPDTVRLHEPLLLPNGAEVEVLVEEPHARGSLPLMLATLEAIHARLEAVGHRPPPPKRYWNASRLNAPVGRGRCEVIITGDQKLATVWNQKRPLPFPISAVLV